MNRPRSPRSTTTLPAPKATLGLLVATGALVLAACSSTPSHLTVATTTTTAPSGHSGTGTQSTSATATTITLPPANTTGPLAVSFNVDLQIPGNQQVVATEGPDGAVFVAPFAKADSSPIVVWVVDGDTAPAIAEHVVGGVAALAADANNLYVANYTTITSYDRNTGAQNGQWNLPSFSTANTSDADLVSMSADNGSVLVMLPVGAGEGIYRIKANSTAAPVQVATGDSAAFGPDGSVYYVRSDGHLVGLASGGTSTVGPAMADSPNGEGGGVQNVYAVANGIAWVSEPAGQGLDTQFSAYNASSLKLLGTYSGSVNEQIVGTLAGPLALDFSDGSGSCPQPQTPLATACVFRISSSAQLSQPTPVGEAIQLLGPDPAVVSTNTADTAIQVDRLT
jgi:hypothetical protein